MGRRVWKIAGLALICAAFLGWGRAPKPDLRISDAGKVAFWFTPDTIELDQDKSPILFVDSRRPDRYGREQFAQRAGLPDADWAPYEDRIAQCDSLACRARLTTKPARPPKENRRAWD